MSLEIEFSDQQSRFAVQADRLIDAARQILVDRGITRCSLSLAVVDDPAIRQVNRRHLDHDYATDTISFLFEQEGSYLEGEVLVSAETAARVAPSFGWSVDDELLLYVIHATLHLVGYDDQSDDDRTRMQDAETAYLRRFGVERTAAGAGNASSDRQAQLLHRPSRTGDEST